MGSSKALCLDDFIPLAAQINGDWRLVLETWEEFRANNRGYHLRGDVETDRESFLTQALWLAYGRKQLRPLLLRLEARQLTGKKLSRLAKRFLSNAVMLQAYVNSKWQPQHALVAGRRLIHACDHVCRISIDGRHRGTGFLIRRNIVATAAHVLDPLFDTNGICASDSLARLEISFFDADELLADGSTGSARPVVASLHQDWLPHYSPPAPNEKNGLDTIRDIDGIAHPEGPWDLALIRLGTPPRTGLAGCSLRDRGLDSASFGVHVLHHPADHPGDPMSLLWSIGSITEALGAPSPLRLLHDANTDRGSSGAPCFDDNWKVVALHQAGLGKVSDRDQVNRAVPIYAWVPQIDANVALVNDTPYLAHVDDNGRRTPVLGRRAFQENAWRTMKAGGKASERTFVVLGDSQAGKTFSIRLLEALARQAGCRVATLDAGNAQNDGAFDFAQKILGSCGGTLPPGVGLPSGLTTSSRDFRQEVLPQMIQGLDDISADKPMWLVIDRLDTCDVPGNKVAEVVEALLESLDKELPRVNVLLLGWKGVVDARHVETSPATPLVDDIVDHIWLALAPAGFELGEEARGMLSILVQQNLDRQVQQGGYAPAIAAAEDLTLHAVTRAQISSLAEIKSRKP